MMDEPEAKLPETTLYSLTLSMAYNIKKYDRKVYSIFDWLAATGGLLDIIERFFGIIVVFFSLRIFNVHMNERLFMVPKAVDNNGMAADKEKKSFSSNCCRILCFEYCFKPFKCCCKERMEKNAIYKEGDLYERGVEKLERALDVEQLRKDHRLLLDMKFLMLDDPYLRKLLKIQRWKRVIEKTSRNEESQEDSEATSEDNDTTTAEHLERLKKDQARLPELYELAKKDMKMSILARLVDGVNERYALRKDIGCTMGE
jgi:hypothetical protein